MFQRLHRTMLLGLCILLISVPAFVQAQQSATGVTVTCDTGNVIHNGVEIIVNQMRSGYTYTATAVGLNGFDPVLAVLNSTGQGLCSDDTAAAASTVFSLPTTGSIGATSHSALVNFNQDSSSTFDDVSLVVGGVNDTTGEFVLILQGMAVTSADGAGDPFSVRVTPEMVASGIPLTVYMMSLHNDLDPFIERVDGTGSVARDNTGALIACDDGGDTQRCWGQSNSLTNSGVATASVQVNGGSYDAMLSIPLAGLQLSTDSNQNFMNFIMTSYNQSSAGQYILVFHMGTAATSSQFGDPTNQTTKDNTPPPVVSGGNSTGLPVGLAVTCDNGTTFNNGVEIRVIQMRTGFNYTATAVGLNGFDPILAVLDDSGSGLCHDDDAVAAQYSFSLPTTGAVQASQHSAHITFANNGGSGFADISLVVGGLNDSVGEFVLIVEGMGVTNADGAGDPFEVFVTPEMVAAANPMTVYMLARTSGLDPLMYVMSNNQVATDANNVPFMCDDGGNSSTCYDPNISLAGSYVTTANGTVQVNAHDAMLVAPTNGVPLGSDPTLNFLRFMFTSYNQASTGQYILAFDITLANP